MKHESQTTLKRHIEYYGFIEFSRKPSLCLRACLRRFVSRACVGEWRLEFSLQVYISCFAIKSVKTQMSTRRRQGRICGLPKGSPVNGNDLLSKNKNKDNMISFVMDNSETPHISFLQIIELVPGSLITSYQLQGSLSTLPFPRRGGLGVEGGEQSSLALS